MRSNIGESSVLLRLLRLCLRLRLKDLHMSSNVVVDKNIHASYMLILLNQISIVAINFYEINMIDAA